jgi:hypothetical protein
MSLQPEVNIDELTAMKRATHEILILSRSVRLSQTDMEREMEWLNDILTYTESADAFCRAHELVNRNRITQKSSKILKALKKTELKPFRFLIGKN